MMPPRTLRDVPCLVTGATGFIGRQLVTRLRDEGAYVRGVARSPGASDANELARVDLVTLDRDSPLLDGIEIVFHLAAKTHDLHDAAGAESEYRRINVDATTRLLGLKGSDALRRVVFVSSVKAIDEGNGVPADERTRPAPSTMYGRSKLEAEQIVSSKAAERGVESVCLRFPLVYGPGQPGNLQRMIVAIKHGRFPPPPREGNRRSMLHVDNAVAALVLAAAHPAAAGQTYFVTDARPYSTREIYDTVREALGLPPARLAMPRWVFESVALGGDLARTLTGKRIGFDSEALQKLLGSAVYRIDKIQRELGYEPERDLLSTLPALVRRSDEGQS